MQILMTKAAFDRVGDRLAAVAPDAQVVTVVSAEAYELAGRPIAAEDIDPEVVCSASTAGPPARSASCSAG